MTKTINLEETLFFGWLKVKTNFSTYRDIKNYYYIVEDMLLQKHVIPQSLLDIHNLEIVLQAKKNAKIVFCYNILLPKVTRLLNLYSDFIRQTPKSFFKTKEESCPIVLVGKSKKPNEQIIKHVSPIVQKDWIRFDFSNSVKFEKTVPAYCNIGDTKIEGNTWARVLVNITENEISQNNILLKDLYNNRLRSKKKGNPFFMKEKLSGLNCQKLSNGFWINLNYSIPALMEIIAALCLHCGYKKEQVVIYGVPKEINLTKIDNELEENLKKYSASIELLLSKYFKFGFPANSTLDLLRLKNYAQQNKIELPQDENKLKSLIASVGIPIEGKVLIVKEAVIEKLRNMIKKITDKEISVIFYDSVFSENEAWLEENQIISSTILKGILSTVTNQYFFAKNFISVNGRMTEGDAVVHEIKRVWPEQNIASVDLLSASLPYVPYEKILHYLSCTNEFVWASEGHYYLVERLNISQIDKDNIIEYIENECEKKGFASISSIPLGNIPDDNYELSIYSLYNALYYGFLNKTYHMNSKILTKNNESLGAVSIVENYCNGKDRCTFNEVSNIIIELTGNVNRQYAFDALYKTMIRTSKNDYVTKRAVHFDVRAIDSIISTYITDRFIALKDVTNFALFPECGLPWNHYLLECYCISYSEKFKLVVNRYNDKNVGIIALKNIELAYYEMLAYAAARASIELTNEIVGQYLYNEGYIAKRKFSNLEDITNRAKSIRKER